MDELLRVFAELRWLALSAAAQVGVMVLDALGLGAPMTVEPCLMCQLEAAPPPLAEGLAEDAERAE